MLSSIRSPLDGICSPFGPRRGGSASWTPADLPNLALWLDADDASTITLNGSTVSQWNDKSGNGRNVSQATAAQQPPYNGTINGKAALSFTNAHKLFRTSAFMYSAGAVSAFTVIRPTPASINFFIVSESNSVSSLPIYSPITNGATASITNQGFWLRNDVGNSTSTEVMFAGGLATADRIVGLIDDGTDATAYNNGTAGTPFTYDPTIRQVAGTFDRFVINGLERPAPTAGQQVVMGEVVITTGVLSTTDRQKLEGYLAWKWGLQEDLPSDHPYRFDGRLFGYGAVSPFVPFGSDLLITSDGDVFVV